MATRKKAKAKKARSKKKKAPVRAGARKAARRTAPKRKTGAKKASTKAKRRAKSRVGTRTKARAKAKTGSGARSPGKTARPKARAASPAPSVAPLPVSSMSMAPASTAATERAIGTVTHYYSDLSVAIVRLDSGALREGDTVRIKGHTSDFTQPVESMEIDHLRVDQAYPGQAVGLRVREHARENDVVYKVEG